jgi:hypothetical protein
MDFLASEAHIVAAYLQSIVPNANIGVSQARSKFAANPSSSAGRRAAAE